MEANKMDQNPKKKSLKATQKPIAKESSLTSDEVRAIIKSCSTYGVLELKFKGLEISLTPKGSEARNEKTGKQSEQEKLSNNPVNEITEQAHETQNQDALEADELRLREDQLAMAFIEDPVLAEEMIRNGELDDFESESDDDAE